MNWGDIQKQWAAEPAGTPAIHMETLLGQARDLNAKLRRRDRNESLVSAVCVVLFGFFAFTDFIGGNLLASAFALMVVVHSAFVPVWLRRARRHLPGEDRSRSSRDYLEQQHAGIRMQVRMLRNVAWWYVAPSAIGVIGMTLAHRGNTAFAWAYSLGVVALGVYIVYLNRRGARRLQEDADLVAGQLRLLEESGQ